MREQFPTVNLVDLVVSEIDGDIDNNTVEVQMFYAVENTGISDGKESKKRLSTKGSIVNR